MLARVLCFALLLLGVLAPAACSVDFGNSDANSLEKLSLGDLDIFDVVGIAWDTFELLQWGYQFAGFLRTDSDGSLGSLWGWLQNNPPPKGLLKRAGKQLMKQVIWPLVEGYKLTTCNYESSTGKFLCKHSWNTLEFAL